MLRTIFTLDYEIHGNGEGHPQELMVEPTSRMLDLFDEYGAKLTVMADVGEILSFRRHALETGRDDYGHAAIAEQLSDVVRRGHDVQLHIHSSYFNARPGPGGWQQDWAEYDFARLPPDRMDHMVREGKAYLEELLRPVMPAYRCTAFRAANWSVSPSAGVVSALLDNGLLIDSSVFKHGKRSGLVTFDYTHAASALLPWRVDPQDICRAHPHGRLWEFPIYAEERGVMAFLSVQRLYRAALGRLHRLDKAARAAPGPLLGETPRAGGRLKALLKRHAWKADFNQCTGSQLVAALERASRRFDAGSGTLPFVLIGHSKLFTRLNERSLRPFLEHVKARPDRFGFGCFRDFPLANASFGVQSQAGTPMGSRPAAMAGST